MKKVLILYTSIGLGHKYIALNIAYHLEQAGYRVKLHDVLQLQEGRLVDFGTWLHSVINRRLPMVWRWLYFSKLVNLIGLPLRIPLAKSNSENVYKEILNFEPDLVISTQTTASAAVSSLIVQNKYQGKFVIAFSDYHLHKFWLYDQADLYLTNIEEQKLEMVGLGIDPDKIAVCGITLKPFQMTDKAALKKRYNIPQDNKVLLFGSGSLGIGFSQSLLLTYLQELNKIPQLFTIVLCGKNNDLRLAIDKLKLPNILALPFTDEVSQIYQITDLFVTKPGGLTIAESLQANLKILITHTLPGQEEPNYDYLLKNHLIYPAPKRLNLHTLLLATKVALRDHPDHSIKEPSIQITQKNNEGVILKNSINKLFHDV